MASQAWASTSLQVFRNKTEWNCYFRKMLLKVQGRSVFPFISSNTQKASMSHSSTWMDVYFELLVSMFCKLEMDQLAKNRVSDYINWQSNKWNISLAWLRKSKSYLIVYAQMIENGFYTVANSQFFGLPKCRREAPELCYIICNSLMWSLC